MVLRSWWGGTGVSAAFETWCEILQQTACFEREGLTGSFLHRVLAVAVSLTCMVVEDSDTCASRLTLSVPQQGSSRWCSSGTPTAVVSSNHGKGVAGASTGLGTGSILTLS
jgi:hypothetical protein